MKNFKNRSLLFLVIFSLFIFSSQVYARGEYTYEGTHVYLLINSHAFMLYNESIESHIQDFARDFKKLNPKNRVSLIMSNSYDNELLTKEADVFDDIHILSRDIEGVKPLDLTSNMEKFIELQKTDNSNLKQVVILIDNDGGLSNVSFDYSQNSDFQKTANEHMIAIYSSAMDLMQKFKPYTEVFVIRTRTPHYVLEGADMYDDLFYLNQTRSMTEVLFDNIKNSGLYYVYFDIDEMKTALSSIKEKLVVSVKEPMHIINEKRDEELKMDLNKKVPHIGRFNDVRDTDWYHHAVYHVVQNFFMTGTGNSLFSPEEDVTRAQIAQILYNIDGRKSVGKGSFFKDVKESQWYIEAVNWAYENGIVSGYGNGSFGPNDPVTREQAMTIMYRYIKKDTNEEITGSPLDVYGDKNRISPYAVEAMTWASYEKVLNGDENKNLNPLDKMKRSEIAQILYKLHNKQFFVKKS